jgi:hypothetical protein
VVDCPEMAKEEVIRQVFPPGEEPQILTADLCAEYDHDRCPGHITQNGEPVFCVCWCHRKADSEATQ